MRIPAIAACCVLLGLAAASSAQAPTPSAHPLERVNCPAEVDLPTEIFHERRPTTDLLAHLRFCGMDDVHIPTVQLDWNPSALDVWFEVVAPPHTAIEIRLGARVFAASGIEISSQSRTFEVRAGKTKKHRLRLSRSTKWLQEHGDRLQLVVFDISPS